jgi:hypothetical protein
MTLFRVVKNLLLCPDEEIPIIHINLTMPTTSSGKFFRMNCKKNKKYDINHG